MDNFIITINGRKKLAMAGAGEITLPKVEGMAFGDGGVDADGNVLAPIEMQGELTHELYRKVINGYSFPSDTTCRYECSLTESELPRADISEIGLYDEEGDIICIKTFKVKGKDDDLEMIFHIDDMF